MRKISVLLLLCLIQACSPVQPAPNPLGIKTTYQSAPKPTRSQIQSGEHDGQTLTILNARGSKARYVGSSSNTSATGRGGSRQIGVGMTIVAP